MALNAQDIYNSLPETTRMKVELSAVRAEAARLEADITVKDAFIDELTQRLEGAEALVDALQAQVDDLQRDGEVDEDNVVPFPTDGDPED